jgi:DNA-directed RNA polymerase specialized sigma subunit
VIFAFSLTNSADTPHISAPFSTARQKLCLALKKVDTIVNKKMENTRIKKRRKPKTLTQEERIEVVKRHYLEGRSQASLSREYGVAESVVSRINSNFAAENDKSALFMKKDAKTSESDEI